MVRTEFQFRPASWLVGLKFAQLWVTHVRGGGRSSHRCRRDCANAAVVFGGPFALVHRSVAVTVCLPCVSVVVELTGRGTPARELVEAFNLPEFSRN